jgi:NAD(P)H-hydrate epimerase
VVVFVGPGANGGDGLVAARHLHCRGLSVEVALATEAKSLTGEPLLNFNRLAQLGLRVEPFELGYKLGVGDVVVDALFGTGLTRPIEGRAAAAIEVIEVGHRAGARVVAVDLPSGLNTDSGHPLGACVRADMTVTFGALKIGLCLEPGASLAGEVVVADISIPPEALEELPARAELLEERSIRALFKPRPRDSHKGRFGHLLVIAGSSGKWGAAALAARGALRSGVGLVTCVARGVSPALGPVPEAMTVELLGKTPLGREDLPVLLQAAEEKSALAIGPGIQRGPETAALLGQLLAEFHGPAVLDADALNALAGSLELLHAAAGPVVLTPHPGEMARLCDLTIEQVQADRIGVARGLAQAQRLTVVLKGARTVVADPDGTVAVVPTGNPGMATGGTGDVLCGMLGSLLAQGLPMEEAARAAPYLHGLAGDRVARRLGQRGLKAGDVADELGALWSDWGL